MKHAKPESPLERADRMIAELTAPGWLGNYPRHHATDNRHQERLDLMHEFHSFPIRYVMEVGKSLNKYGLELQA